MSVLYFPLLLGSCHHLTLLLPDFSLLGSGGCCCLCIWTWRGARLSCSPPPTFLFPIYILLARFIVRKISSVAAITCSIQVSFFWEEGSAVITWRWMLISFLLLFFPNLAGNIVAADSRISLIAHLFTARLKLDFFVVVFGQLFSLFPHLTGKA